jgi:hypothetical protein
MVDVDVAEELNRLSPFIASAVRKSDPEHLDPVIHLITENRSRLVERSALRPVDCRRGVRPLIPAQAPCTWKPRGRHGCGLLFLRLGRGHK